MDNRLKLKGKFKFELTKPDGRVIETVEYNSIVNTGFQHIADSLFLLGGNAQLDQIAVGFGTTAVSPEDIALESPQGNKTPTYTYSDKVATLEATFIAGEATGAITEAGILSSAGNPVLLNRVTFSTINKAVDDTLKVTFTITLS